ncbi:MAG: hypothetical protein ACKVK0_17415, partial [Pirellulales bacterium]
LLHHRPEGDLDPVQGSELNVIPDAVAAGHYLHPTGSTNRLRIAVVELGSSTRQCIQSGVLKKVLP